MIFEMKFKVGDSIAVLDDVIRGKVHSINGNTITIIDASEMQFNYFPSDLVKIDTDQNELSKYSDIHNPLLQYKIHEKQAKKQSPFLKTKNEVILEVDLHINQLIKSKKGMDNFDILNLQIDTARRKLEYAIQKRISKLVFIHGVGEGVLKAELHYLFNRYPVKYYDASYQKYGLGATEVYILQNPN